MNLKVKEIAAAIEAAAPLSLQESYDNAGLQVGNPDMQISAVLLCLDLTEDILREATKRECNLIVTHHPLIFRGLKRLTGATQTERIVEMAIREGIAVYSAHTNLDAATEGVSAEIAHALGLTDIRPLHRSEKDEAAGLGIIGNIKPTPKIEFLRRLKEDFGVKSLRYSAQSPQIVVRKVAVCGGAGAGFIGDALRQGADVYVTGDLKYHDFTTYGLDLLLADIGHYESELCTMKIFSKIIREKYPDCQVFFADEEVSPIATL